MRSKTVLKCWAPLAAVLLIIGALCVLPTEEYRETATYDNPVLVIDPGHGGADGGAVAPDGTEESDINLDIALRLEALAGFWGVDTVMTRDQKDIDYPAGADTISAMKKADQYARVALINSTPGAVLLSIHQNNYTSSAPSGIQVFYSPTAGSDALAETLQANLTAQLCPDNRRVAAQADESIYLMKKAECTAVLVECGFLSNPQELDALKTGAYRLELAATMLASYLQYIRGLTV